MIQGTAEEYLEHYKKETKRCLKFFIGGCCSCLVYAMYDDLSICDDAYFDVLREEIIIALEAMIEGE